VGENEARQLSGARPYVRSPWRGTAGAGGHGQHLDGNSQRKQCTRRSIDLSGQVWTVSEALRIARVCG